ncbi:hypothetical protein Tco_0073020 [Tanacetum coccineum]
MSIIDFQKYFSELEQHCISLEIAMKLNKENFQTTNTFVNQTEPSFDQLFELNNLKAELQAKDTTIKKLKAHIKRINETSTSKSVKKDFDEIETINIEDIGKSICHNSIKNDLRKLKGKHIVANAAKMSNVATIAPKMYKLDPVTLAPKLIQELLGYVRDTCPDIHKPRVNPSTSANGSMPSGNTKNDRIPQTPSSNEKNKVEVQSRKVKSSLNKRNSASKNVCNEHVKHPVKGAKALCLVCNECLFNANHAMCLINHVNSMNVRDKSASKKNKNRKQWKPTRKVFNSVGYKWKPTERTFTLVENA